MKSRTKRTQGTDVTKPPLAAEGMRIGLLGGSFNPAHEAHREISVTALKRLGLDQVWWLVTPANPLKDPTRLPTVEERVQAARKIARHPRIEVTGFSPRSVYTVDLIAELKRRFPRVKFVWLMGADNLAGFHHWRSWEEIFAAMPIAVFDRPGFRLKARAGKAAQRFAPYMVDESDAAGVAVLVPPAWTILTHKLSPLSSTAIRSGKTKQEKAKSAARNGKKKSRRH